MTPPRATGVSPTQTSMREGETSTPDEPTACRIRPGFGSDPNTAVFTRGESATAFAIVRASPSLEAPSTSTSVTVVTPSASRISCDASAAPTSSTASASAAHARSAGPTVPSPAAPLANSSTVSFVLVQPSTVSAVNRGFSRSCASPARSRGAIAASVVTKASIVARFGLIIPTPFAAPPTRYGPDARLRGLRHRVRRHDRVGERGDRRRVRAPPRATGIAASTSGRCTGSPITPVEHASMSSAPARRRPPPPPRRSAGHRPPPRSPVAAFA